LTWSHSLAFGHRIYDGGIRGRSGPMAVSAGHQVVAAAVAVIASLSEQLVVLEVALTQAFSAHWDAGIMQSQPGLGVVLGAALLRCAGPGHAEAAISVLDQIANASSSNASATRRLIRSSTASS
jgi:hypothetical protein